MIKTKYHKADDINNLIDLLGNSDLVDESGNWTDEGIASLGLYAQQMEAAEAQAKSYEEQINYLNENWQSLGYTEEEYIDKLSELKDGQYDSIQAYYDAQKAIVDLNKTRVDAIKKGIEKEIEAYEELIKKKKEALDADKDMYDFTKTIMEKEKNIAEIRRKIAALEGDNSASALSKKKQLEAELAEANADLQDSYYDRSVNNQQDALDKELENFQEEKEEEIEKLEKWLEDIEAVVSDSLGIVKANAEEIGNTLTSKAEEYNLIISDAILSPWSDGSIAVSDYQNTFDTAMSSTTDQLNGLKDSWQEVIDKMDEYGQKHVDLINQNNDGYTSATYTPPADTGTSDDKGEDKEDSKPSLTKGSYVEVKPGTRWYADSFGGGASGGAAGAGASGATVLGMSLGKLALVAGGAAAAIGLVAGVVALMTHEQRQAEKQAKKLAEAVEESEKAYQKAADAQKGFQSSLSSFNSAIDSINKLTKGTLE